MIDIANKLSGKVVAITGASGYIGSALSKELSKYPVKIICISRKELSSKHGAENWVLDLGKSSSWNRIVSEVDIIFHLAGNTSIQTAEQDPEESLISTLFPITKLINASKELCRVPRVVFASTVTVYGLTDVLPVSESTKPNPITMYDLHKLFAEQQLAMASQNNIISATSLRLANVFGPSLSESSASDRGVLNKVTRTALQGKDLTIYGHGNYLRDYVYIDDVVSAFICASISENTRGRSFNISGQVGCTVREIFELIANKASKLIGREISVNQASWPADVNAIEYRNFIGDADAFYDATKWSPRISVKLGVDMMVNFYNKI